MVWKEGLAILIFAVCSFVPGSSLLGQGPVFEFQLSWDSQPGTVTDLSFLNDRPAGGAGFVRAGTDGHLYAGDRRIRFLGVNVSNISAFPEHSDAEWLARRLARFGVNIVRFHLMDADWGNGGIFDRTSAGTRTLDPSALDKLDYFVAELKKNGIYSNFNLLTGRSFHSADGLSSSIDRMEWKAKQTPALFNSTMIALQKEYATQLLDRVNPYTGVSYLREPALAVVEVVNEHGLMHAWLDGRLDSLPADYSEELRAKWNNFLAGRYASHQELESAWSRSSPPGVQLLRNGDFSSELAYWNLERHAGAVATSVLSGTTPTGKPAVRISVAVPGVQDWHVQFNQGQLPVESQTVYTVSFWARADRAKHIELLVEQAHDPWQSLGLLKQVSLTTSWKRFEYSFALTGSDSNARLNFRKLGDQAAIYWLGDVSLTPGGKIGVFPGENLQDGTIRLIFRNEMADRTDPGREDFARFLWQTESEYWLEMRRHLKETLGGKALLAGTVVGTSTPNLMALFDIIDAHAYWQHPSFVSGWGSPWWIRNASMVRETDGGTLTGLSVKRVEGLPFSVSEYNHPFPNSFGSEAMLVLAAYAAFQDWDAIYGYTYADGKLNWGENRLSGYFDLHADPGKMATFQQAAYLFRQGAVSAGEHLVSVGLSREREIELLPKAGPWRLVDAEHAGMDRRIALLHRTSVTVDGSSPPGDAHSPSQVGLPGNSRFVTDTGELDWDAASGVLRIDSQRSKGLIGYVTGQGFDLGGTVFRPAGSLQRWAAILLTEMGRRSVGEKKFLLSAHGLVQNSDQMWAYFPSGNPAGFPPPSDVDLTLTRWGSQPVLAEGIGAEIVLPFAFSRVRVFALDGRGVRKSPVPVTDEAGNARFEISVDYQTLWYEVLVELDVQKSAIPGFRLSTQEFLGIAIANAYEEDAAVTLTLLDREGDPEMPGHGPVERFVPPRNQLAELSSELFGEPVGLPLEGWVEVASDSPLLGIFAQKGDFGLSYLDGTTAVHSPGRELFLTRVYEGDGQFLGRTARTTLTIANPGDAPTSIRIRLLELNPAQENSLKRVSSRLATEAVRSIPSRGVLVTAVEELFGANASGVLRVETLQGGGVVSSAEVLLPESGSMFAMNALPEGASTHLYSAQLASVPGYLFTSLNLINTSPETRHVVLEAIADDGERLGGPVEIALAPGEVFQRDAYSVFEQEPGSLPSRQGDSGWVGSLRVEVREGSGVIGDVVFGLEDLGYVAALPLQSEAFRKAVFGHVANLPGRFFTGLAVFNPGPDEAQLEIGVFSPEGQLVQKTTLKLASGCRISELLATLMPDTGNQQGGYILLESSHPVIAQELFGTMQLSLLSAVPPKILE